MRRLVLGFVLLWIAGCAAATPEHAFVVDESAARTALKEMNAQPTPLVRPVILIDGYLDPGFGSRMLAADIRRATGDDRIRRISSFGSSDLPSYAQRVQALAERAFPGETVDLVGISMGGLAAIDAASRFPGQVGRVFTLCSPLRGAVRAKLPSLMPAQIQMRPGSDYIAELPARAALFGGPIISYAGLADTVVRPGEASLPGRSPYWLPVDGSAAWGHGSILRDARLRADLIRRLRGETPLTVDDPPALPAE